VGHLEFFCLVVAKQQGALRLRFWFVFGLVVHLHPVGIPAPLLTSGAAASLLGHTFISRLSIVDDKHPVVIDCNIRPATAALGTEHQSDALAGLARVAHYLEQ
jgi:hypothetical protein